VAKVQILFDYHAVREDQEEVVDSLVHYSVSRSLRSVAMAALLRIHHLCFQMRLVVHLRLGKLSTYLLQRT
jgi:hypothetical protein